MQLTAQEKRDALTHKPEDVDRIWALALAKKWNDSLVAGRRFSVVGGAPYTATKANIACVFLVNGKPEASVAIAGISRTVLVEDCEWLPSYRDEAIEALETCLGLPYRPRIEEFVDSIIAAAKADNPK